MQNKKFNQINIMIPVPLEAVEISGILDEPVIKVRPNIRKPSTLCREKQEKLSTMR